jgi:LAS superfamily LD-carboxypeptidase LdcB
LDLWEATNSTRYAQNAQLKSYIEWMEKNAEKYGFTNTYQK